MTLPVLMYMLMEQNMGRVVVFYLWLMNTEYIASYSSSYVWYRFIKTRQIVTLMDNNLVSLCSAISGWLSWFSFQSSASL